MRLQVQRALRFLSLGSHLVGIIDVPERPYGRGLLALSSPGGYRVGSRRQFTLLARVVARRGSPVMRFDRRGSGDSEGQQLPIDQQDQDINAAIDEFFRQIPELAEVVLLGEGDGAAAAALHAPLDPRVCGLVMFNPHIVGSAGGLLGEARQSYLGRLGEFGFWKKVATVSAVPRRQSMREAAADHTAALPQRVLASLACFEGQLLLVFGAGDLDALAFADLLAERDIACKRVEVPGSGPDFSSQAARDQAAVACANWIASW